MLAPGARDGRGFGTPWDVVGIGSSTPGPLPEQPSAEQEFRRWGRRDRYPCRLLGPPEHGRLLSRPSRAKSLLPVRLHQRLEVLAGRLELLPGDTQGDWLGHLQETLALTSDDRRETGPAWNRLD